MYAFRSASVTGGIVDIEAFKKHWLVLYCHHLCCYRRSNLDRCPPDLVSPRDFEIARLQKQIDDLKSKPSAAAAFTDRSDRDTNVLPETGVFENNSATTSDGVCSIQIVQVRGNTVVISVTTGSGEPKIFRDLRPGSQVAALFKRKEHRIS
jgi:hypothetical protein